MNNSVLFPPNCNSLSDNVIRDVVGRAQRLHYYNKTWSPVAEPARANSTQEQTIAINYHHDNLSPTTSELVEQPSRDRRTKSKNHKSNENASMQLSHAERLLIRRRQQSRVNMARHRKKIQDLVISLEEDIQLLREETHKLELQRQLLDYGISIKMTPWNVVAEYFRLFRYAIKMPVKIPEPCNTSNTLHLHDLRAFLQSTMAPDLIVETGRGVEALLEEYRRISLYHPDLNVQLVHLENGAENSMIATTIVKVTIVKSTLESAFPHLVNDPELWATLGSKLIGQELVMSGSAHIRWDDNTDRVVCLHYNADY